MVKKSLKRHIIQVLTVALLFSCSPQKRLNRLVKKYPHLTEVSIDTIRVVDTFIVQQYDTTLINNFIKLVFLFKYEWIIRFFNKIIPKFS